MTAHLMMYTSRKRVAVVCGYDAHSFSAIKRAINEGFAEFVLVGEVSKYNNYLELDSAGQYITVVDARDCEEAAWKAVSLIREGKADILMKGIINTDVLLHAILNKDEIAFFLGFGSYSQSYQGTTSGHDRLFHSCLSSIWNR